MSHLSKPIVDLSLVVVLFIGACSAPASQSSPMQPQPTADVTKPEKSIYYDDPLAYCAAVGTINTPEEPYTGIKMPDAIVEGMIKQKIVSVDASLEFRQNAVGRCMHNSVWVCHFGANLPCLEKADVSQVPTPEMEDFCKTNPTADSIPAVVTGRATVYEWKCNAGKPEVVRQVFQVDLQGYLADFWYELVSSRSPE